MFFFVCHENNVTSYAKHLMCSMLHENRSPHFPDNMQVNTFSLKVQIRSSSERWFIEERQQTPGTLYKEHKSLIHLKFLQILSPWFFFSFPLSLLSESYLHRFETMCLELFSRSNLMSIECHTRLPELSHFLYRDISLLRQTQKGLLNSEI